MGAAEELRDKFAGLRFGHGVCGCDAGANLGRDAGDEELWFAFETVHPLMHFLCGVVGIFALQPQGLKGWVRFQRIKDLSVRLKGDENRFCRGDAS